MDSDNSNSNNSEQMYSLAARSEREAVRGITVGDTKVSPDSIIRLDPVMEGRLRHRLRISLCVLTFMGAALIALAVQQGYFTQTPQQARHSNQPVTKDIHWPFTDASPTATANIRTLLEGDLGCIFTIPLGETDKKEKSNPLPGESWFDYQRELGLLRMTSTTTKHNDITVGSSNNNINNSTSSNPSTTHGTFTQDESILCLHRKSPYWLEPQFITPSSIAMPAETLVVLGKDKDNNDMYRLIMALVVAEKNDDNDDKEVNDGLTSVSFQSNPENKQRIVVTSETGGTVAIYAGIGSDPYALLAEGATMASQLAVSKYTKEALYLATSPLIVQTKFHILTRLPDFARYLGWCTWNAFYTKYDGTTILAGVDKLQSQHVPVRWMILDDGWQHTTNDTAVQEKLSLRRFQRLAKLDSSPTKFAPDHISYASTGTGSTTKKAGKQPAVLISLNETIRQLKLSRDKGGKGLDYVLAWHAISGYWLGLENRSEVPQTTESNAAWELSNVSLYFPQFSAGLITNSTMSSSSFMETQREPSIKLGIGIPDNATDFYSRYYAYMREVGIDGVKVDDQASLGPLRPFPSKTTPDPEYRHRHQVTTRLHQALSTSVENKFHYHANALPIIHCMNHAPEILFRIPSLYSSDLDRPLPLLRASEDFFPNVPTSHGPMIAASTFNSLLLGYVSVPDWDQFQTNVASSDFAPGHVIAKFHAAARSISGGPIYISDVPGSVNTSLLESLVCTDGSILPCAHAGLPTRSSLLRDPLVAGSAPVVIWNTNGIPGDFPASGVLGIFQLAKSSKRKMTIVDIRAKDIEPFASPLHESANFIGLSFNTMELWLLEGAKAAMPISVPGQNLWSDVISIIPITAVKSGGKTWEIAPLGYVGMFNGVGAILRSQLTNYGGKERFLMSIRGCGEFAAVVRMEKSLSSSLSNQTASTTTTTTPVSFTVRIDAATFTREAIPISSNENPYKGLEEEGFQYISLEVDCISMKSGSERHLSLELLHG